MSGIGSARADNLPYALYALAKACLTDAQAEIIAEIYGRRHIGPFQSFTPLEIYNQYTKRDYLARRELQEMVLAGLVRMVPVRVPLGKVSWRSTVLGRDRKLYRLRFTVRAIRAWEARRVIESRQ